MQMELDIEHMPHFLNLHGLIDINSYSQPKIQEAAWQVFQFCLLRARDWEWPVSAAFHVFCTILYFYTVGVP